MAFVVPVDNVTLANAVLWSQFSSAFNAALGITDPAQTALGRLVLPSSSSAPSSPETGMIYMDSDDGRLYVRSPGGVWVPFVPHRQTAYSSASGVLSSLTATSWADLTNMTLSITTTGGRLEIELVPDWGNPTLVTNINVSGTSAAPAQRVGYIRAMVAAQDLNPIIFGDADQASDTLLGSFAAPGFFKWDYPVAAGTYTVKLQYQVNSGGSMNFSNCILRVKEVGES